MLTSSVTEVSPELDRESEQMILNLKTHGILSFQTTASVFSYLRFIIDMTLSRNRRT